MSDIKPFPPTNNTERYLAAILEELRATRDLVDRLLLIALEDPKPAQDDTPIDMGTLVPEPAPVVEQQLFDTGAARAETGVNPYDLPAVHRKSPSRRRRQ